jgi:hypothetical protein
MVISTLGFGGIITRDRLELICKCLHFANSETINNFERPMKFVKRFLVISHLNNILGSVFPKQVHGNWWITDTLGTPSMFQTVSPQILEVWIKNLGALWSTTGYLGHWNCVQCSKTAEPLLKQGETVWICNYYNSPCLAKTLKTIHKTDCAGRLKFNWKSVLKKWRILNWKKGKLIAQHSVHVSVTKWTDKKLSLWCSCITVMTARWLQLEIKK